MAIKTHALTQDEVTRAELMSFRITLAILLHHFFATHPNKAAAQKEMERAIAQIAGQIQLEMVPPERHRTFRDLVIDRGKSVVKDALSTTRHEGKLN